MKENEKIAFLFDNDEPNDITREIDKYLNSKHLEEEEAWGRNYIDLN